MRPRYLGQFRGSALRIAFGALPFAVVAAVWVVLTEGNFVDPTFLPRPRAIADALVRLFWRNSYLSDVWISIFRVMTAFTLSAGLAVPIGLLAGHSLRTGELVEPFVGFVRYLPVPALVPLCILWFGLGDVAKIVVIFLGTFFQLVLLSADVARTVPREYFEAALTLGATGSQLLRKVLWPASLPGIFSAGRTAVGWAWTYLVVAEIAGATSGIGFRIMQAQRFIETPDVFAGIVVVGLLGLTTDLIFQAIQRVAFRWQ